MEKLIMFEDTKAQYLKSKSLLERFCLLAKAYEFCPKDEWVRCELMRILKNEGCHAAMNFPVFDHTRTYDSGGPQYDWDGYVIGHHLIVSEISFTNKTILDVAKGANDQEMISFLVSKGAKTLTEMKHVVFCEYAKKNLARVNKILKAYVDELPRLEEIYKSNPYCFSLQYSIAMFRKQLNFVYFNFPKEVYDKVYNFEALGHAKWEFCTPMDRCPEYSAIQFLFAIDKGVVDLNIPLSAQEPLLTSWAWERRYRPTMDMELYIKKGSEDVKNLGWALKLLQEFDCSEDSLIYRYLVDKGAKTPSEAMEIYKKTKESLERKEARQAKLRAEEEARQAKLRAEEEAHQAKLRAKKQERRKRLLKMFGLLWLAK